MDTERMIRELRRTAKKHENDVLHTFDTNISAMCTDVANRLEELNQSNKEIRKKTIDDFAEQLKNHYQSYDIDLCLQDNDHLSYTNSILALESYIDEISERLKS